MNDWLAVTFLVLAFIFGWAVGARAKINELLAILHYKDEENKNEENKINEKETTQNV